MTIVNGGVISINALANGGANCPLGASSNAAANLVINGGTLRYTGNAHSSNRRFTIDVNGAILEASGTGILTLTNTGALGISGTGSRSLVLTGANTGINTLAASLADDGSGNSTSLNKYGAGTWALTTNSTYTGATTISAGVLSVDQLANGGANSRIGKSTNAAENLVLNGGTLKYTGAGNTSNRLFSLGTSGGAIDASGTGTLTFSNNGAVMLSGTGSRILVLTGVNTDDNKLASTVADDGSGNSTSIEKTGPGTWLRTRNSSYTGATIINEGILSIDAMGNGGSNSRIGASGNAAENLVLNGGTLRYTGTGNSSNRLFTLGVNGGSINSSGTGVLNLNNTGSIAFSGTGTRTLTLTGGNSNNNILAAVVSNDASFNPTTVSKTGVGIWILTNTNTYTGATMVSEGELRVNGSTSVGSAVNVDGGATIGGTGTINGTVNVAAGGMVSPGNGGAGTLKTGSLVLSGTSNLNFELGTGKDSIEVTGNLTLDGILNVTELSGFNVGTYCLIKYTGTLVNNGIVLGTMPSGYSYSVGTGVGSITLTVNGPMYWDRSIIAGYQPGDGTWGIDNYWTQNGTSLGAWPGANSAARFAGSDGSYNITVNGTQDVDNITFSNSGYTLTNGTINLAGSGGISVAAGKSATIVSVLSGSVGLVLSGGGTLMLTGSNSYTGITGINAGVLSVTSLSDGGTNCSIGASSNDGANLVFNGATLKYTGNGHSTDRLLTIGINGGVIDASGTGAVSFTNAGTLIISGAGTRALTLTGSNTAVNAFRPVIPNDVSFNATSVTKSGVGTWILAGNNSYTGATLISAGALSVNDLALGGSSSNIGASTNAPAGLVFDGGTLLYTGSGSTTNRRFTLTTNGGTIDASGTGDLIFSSTSTLTFSGTGSRTFTLTGTNTGNNRFSLNLGNDGSGNPTSLIKSGTGTWLRNQNSSYTGTTTINDGILSLDAVTNGLLNSRLGASASDASNLVINGGTFRHTGANATSNRLFTLGVNGGTIEASGTGNLTLNNTGSVAISGTGNRVLTLTGTRTGTNKLYAVISDDASSNPTSVLKSGAGQWVLYADNQYTGATTINGGNLTVGSLADGGISSNIGVSSSAASNLVMDGGTLKYIGGAQSCNEIILAWYRWRNFECIRFRSHKLRQ